MTPNHVVMRSTRTLGASIKSYLKMYKYYDIIFIQDKERHILQYVSL